MDSRKAVHAQDDSSEAFFRSLFSHHQISNLTA
jgi:hypothetical protein